MRARAQSHKDRAQAYADRAKLRTPHARSGRWRQSRAARRLGACSKLALDPDDKNHRETLYEVHCQLSEGMWLGPVKVEYMLEKCVHDDDPTRTPEALEALAREVFKDVPAKKGEWAFVS